jgi:hypothetical protein
MPARAVTGSIIFVQLFSIQDTKLCGCKHHLSMPI